MKKQVLAGLLCTALSFSSPQFVSAVNRGGAGQEKGRVTIQYMDQSQDEVKPIAGAEFSFYKAGSGGVRTEKTPYCTGRTDSSGVLTLYLPDGTYEVRQNENGVPYRTRDFRLTVPMKNEQGEETDYVEAVPKAEPVKETPAPSETPGPSGTSSTSVTVVPAESTREVPSPSAEPVRPADSTEDTPSPSAEPAPSASVTEKKPSPTAKVTPSITDNPSATVTEKIPSPSVTEAVRVTPGTGSRRKATPKVKRTVTPKETDRISTRQVKTGDSGDGLVAGMSTAASLAVLAVSIHTIKKRKGDGKS